MRKQLISSFVGLLLMGMGTQGLAQDKGWQAGAALPYSLDGLRDWTNNVVWGLCIDGAYAIPLGESKAIVRPGLGINLLPGSEKNLRTISLTGIQINADIVVPLGDTPLSVVTGMSVNTWIKSVSGKSPYAQTVNGIVIPAYTRDNDVSGTVSHPFGKFGLRLGAEYALNEKLAVAVTLQIAELGLDYEFLADENKVNTNANGEVIQSVAPERGKHRVNPSWIQFGVRYKF